MSAYTINLASVETLINSGRLKAEQVYALKSDQIHDYNILTTYPNIEHLKLVIDVNLSDFNQLIANLHNCQQLKNIELYTHLEPTNVEVQTKKRKIKIKTSSVMGFFSCYLPALIRQLNERLLYFNYYHVLYDPDNDEYFTIQINNGVLGYFASKNSAYHMTIYDLLTNLNVLRGICHNSLQIYQIDIDLSDLFIIPDDDYVELGLKNVIERADNIHIYYELDNIHLYRIYSQLISSYCTGKCTSTNCILTASDAYILLNKNKSLEEIYLFCENADDVLDIELLSKEKDIIINVYYQRLYGSNYYQPLYKCKNIILNDIIEAFI